MEKSLSNELFVVGVSLDCLAVGCPENSPIANRLQVLSGQVLSDSQKVSAIEKDAGDLDFLRQRYADYVANTNPDDVMDLHDELEVIFGAKFMDIIKRSRSCSA